MPKVLIRIAADGEWPLLLGDDEALPTGDGARWRYVCDAETRADGNAVRSAWLARRLAPNARRLLDEERANVFIDLNPSQP